MVVCSTHILQHVIHLRQPHGAPGSTSLQAFQHAKPGQKLSGCKRCRQRHLPRHMTCASSSTLSQKAHGNNSAAIAEQDMFLIAGAGIAGLAMAAALIKVGVPCKVLEREPGPRKGGSAIGLWPNAFRALDALGVADHLREQHPLISRVELCTADGGTLKAFSLNECQGAPHEFRGVKRATLLEALQSIVPESCIEYGAAIHSVETDQNGAIAVLETGKKVRARCLIGTDGAKSRVARAVNVPKPNYAGYAAYRGVATMPQGLPIPSDTVRQTWGAGVRAGMYPISDTELYWFTVFNAPEDASFVSSKDRQADALRFLPGWKGGIYEAVEHTDPDTITRSKLTDRWPPIGKGLSKGAVTLAGDALHPMTPNLGQGGCTALEDAVILARKVQSLLQPESHTKGARPTTLRSVATSDLVQVLRDYEKERKSRTRLITIRSNLMGQALQIPFAPVCAVRDFVVKNIYSPRHFLDHANYDCGRLTESQLATR
ncbi:hypothetical protein ABBQ38_000632 [Trebouxia sp. C0009 RCD-2024]